jgi:hypothetical protein
MDYDELVDDLLARHADCERTQMMGSPGVKRNGKLVLLHDRREDAVVFKLPDPVAHGEALKLPGAHLFHPGGGDRVFREWVVIPAEHEAVWPDFAERAVTHAD